MTNDLVIVQNAFLFKPVLTWDTWEVVTGMRQVGLLKLHLGVGVVVGLLSWFCIRSSLWLTNCLQHKRSKVSRSVLQSSFRCPVFSFSNVVFFH